MAFGNRCEHKFSSEHKVQSELLYEICPGQVVTLDADPQSDSSVRTPGTLFTDSENMKY